MRAVLFDLDETLVVEEPAARAAFRATAGHAAARHAVDAERLAQDARLCARELWFAGPQHHVAERIAISSWEGLWCRFAADELAELRDWSQGYRPAAWDAALRRQRVSDPDLAADLGDRFGTERRARHELLPGARELLDDLARDHRLALVTNGASCLQREKLEASGLADRFDAVVVSGDLGTRKPDPAVFRHALELLGARPDEAVMVGDSPERDIDGARACGIPGVLVHGEGPGLAAVAALVRGLAPA
jgi:putative hydrolase of the HAD superfamily